MALLRIDSAEGFQSFKSFVGIKSKKKQFDDSGILVKTAVTCIGFFRSKETVLRCPSNRG